MTFAFELLKEGSRAGFRMALYRQINDSVDDILHLGYSHHRLQRL